jgi:hypothetical protein
MFNEVVAYVEKRSSDNQDTVNSIPLIDKQSGRARFNYKTSDREETTLAFLDVYFNGPELVDVDPREKTCILQRKAGSEYTMTSILSTCHSLKWNDFLFQNFWH